MHETLYNLLRKEIEALTDIELETLELLDLNETLTDYLETQVQ